MLLLILFQEFKGHLKNLGQNLLIHVKTAFHLQFNIIKNTNC